MRLPCFNIRIYMRIRFFLYLSLMSMVHAACLYAEETKPVCRIALVQATLAWGDVEANLLAFEKRIDTCKHCDLIVLPELFTSGCAMKKKSKEESVRQKEHIASFYPEVMEKMKTWASQKQALVMGSTVYEEDGRFFNRLIAAFPDGTCRFYDKHNCFKMGGYTPGKEHLVLEYKGWKVATYICYDLRFPEWSRNTTGYDMAIYVANWPESRREDWNRLLRERAVENKAVIVGVNCAGSDSDGMRYAGDSSVWDTDGQVIGTCREYTDEVKYIDLLQK